MLPVSCSCTCPSVLIQLSGSYEVRDRGIKTDIEMGMACSTYEGEEKHMKSFVVEI